MPPSIVSQCRVQSSTSTILPVIEHAAATQHRLHHWVVALSTATLLRCHAPHGMPVHPLYPVPLIIWRTHDSPSRITAPGTANYLQCNSPHHAAAEHATRRLLQFFAKFHTSVLTDRELPTTWRTFFEFALSCRPRLVHCLLSHIDVIRKALRPAFACPSADTIDCIISAQSRPLAGNDDHGDREGIESAGDGGRLRRAL